MHGAYFLARVHVDVPFTSRGQVFMETYVCGILNSHLQRWSMVDCVFTVQNLKVSSTSGNRNQFLSRELSEQKRSGPFYPERPRVKIQFLFVTMRYAGG